MMSKDGCELCPVSPCGAEYRGSECSALRHRHSVDFDPLSRGEKIRMDTRSLAEFFCANTDCATCKLYARCDTSKETPLLDYLNQPEADTGPKPICKVGDIVYINGIFGGECESHKIVSITRSASGVTGEFYYMSKFVDGDGDAGFFDTEIGRSVFLSPIEAMAALRTGG